jgi:hypothetical protein
MTQLKSLAVKVAVLHRTESCPRGTSKALEDGARSKSINSEKDLLLQTILPIASPLALTRESRRPSNGHD